MDEDGNYRQMLDALKRRAKLQYDETVDVARRKYERTIDAIEEVEHLLDGGYASVGAFALTLPLSLVDEAQPSAPVESVAPQEMSDGTLISKVERVFRALPQSIWSVVSMEKRLRAEGCALKAINPQTSINTALARLVERKIIYITEKGSGRRPNMYRLLPFEKNVNQSSNEEGGA